MKRKDDTKRVTAAWASAARENHPETQYVSVGPTVSAINGVRKSWQRRGWV